MSAVKAQPAAAVGALRGDRLQLNGQNLTAREATERRKASERVYGVPISVSAYERSLYEAEGLAPPTE